MRCDRCQNPTENKTAVTGITLCDACNQQFPNPPDIGPKEDQLVTMARIAADWIQAIGNDEFAEGIIPLPRDSVPNSAKPIPTPDEFATYIRFLIMRKEHPSFINVYRAVNGWQTSLMCWDDEGFYDVWQTGFGPYGHDKEGYDTAVQEGKSWAEDEGVEFKESPPFEPLKEGEPRNLVECMAQIAAKEDKQ